MGGALRKLRKSTQASRKPILFVPEDYELDRLVGTVTDGKASINAIVIRSDTMLDRLREKLAPIIPEEG